MGKRRLRIAKVVIDALEDTGLPYEIIEKKDHVFVLIGKKGRVLLGGKMTCSRMHVKPRTTQNTIANIRKAAQAEHQHGRGDN